MNKFDVKMNNIIKKYFSMEQCKKEINMKDKIGEVLAENNSGKFALWGAGDHTDVLFKYFSFDLRECKVIIDVNEGKKGKIISGKDVILPNDLSKYEIDTIFISSFAARNDIKDSIKKILPKCKIVDFYDEIIKKYNLKLEAPFYLVKNIKEKIYNLKEQYYIQNDAEEKRKLLNKLIVNYLIIRDIKYAKFFIEEYIEKKYYRYNDKIKLLTEIDILIGEIKKGISKRNGNDIVLMYLDALRAKDVYGEKFKMNFLHSILKDTAYYTNAFSPSIFTFESFPSILTGKLPFTDELYKYRDVSQDDVAFINKAVEKGYKIKFYTIDFWKMVEGKDIERKEYGFNASENIWNYLIDIAEEEATKTLSLLYFLQETHPPHVCAYHTVRPISHNTLFASNDIVAQTQEDFQQQYYDCLNYMDEQLKFFCDITNGKITKIFFSDHGQIIENAMDNLKDISTLAGWHDERYNVPLIIMDSKMEAKEYKELICLNQLGSLVTSILCEEKFENENKYMEMNFSKIYNNVIIDKYKESGLDDYINGYKVIRDNDYKLVITGNGNKKVYVLPEQFLECTDLNLKRKIVEYFESIVDITMPEF